MADDKENTEPTLEDISRPPSYRVRNGSRVSQASADMVRRAHMPLSSSLELLPNDAYAAHEYDIEVEEYASDSGSEYSSESEGYVTRGDDAGRQEVNLRTDEQKALEGYPSATNKPSQDLVTLEQDDDDDDGDVDSEEERDIMKEIRYEITNQVKADMKEELDQLKIEFNKGTEERDKNADLEGLEPKVKEAMLRMRKLDRILKKRVKREKEVKRDRILLQKRLREELENIRPEGKEYTEVKVNTQKFLALTLPPSHDEGVEVQFPPERSPAVTPLFQTQVLEDHMRAANEKNGQNVPFDQSSHSHDGSSSGRASVETSINLSPRDSEASHRDGRRRKRSKRNGEKKKKEINFIERNIELASDAGNIVAMTDDEKKRLEDLMTDIDAIPETPEEDDASQVGENPFQVSLASGEGYLLEDDDSKRMSDIDNRLSSLLPPEDFRAIMYTPQSQASTVQEKLFTRTNIRISVDADRTGERSLKEAREHRDLQTRLKAIEEELSSLTCAVELEMESPTLSEDQLADLLDQCSRTMSRATEETDSLAQTPRSPRSARAELLENPPKLSEDVLRQLLEDARSSVASTPATDFTDNQSPDSYPLSPDRVAVESITEETLQALLREPRTTSRASSHSSSGSSSNGGHRSLSANTHPTKLQIIENGRQKKPEPFLPEINMSVSLSTQKLNNARLNNEESAKRAASAGGRNSGTFLHNSLSGSGSDDLHLEDAQMYDLDQGPRPPSLGKRGNSGGKTRTYSPLAKSYD